MDRAAPRGVRVTATPKPGRAGGRAGLVNDLTAVGMHVTGGSPAIVEGVVPPDNLAALAAVPDVSIQVNEEFQLSPREWEGQ